MTGWIAETLFATTLLMAVVLLLRGPVSRTFGPRVAYALWLLPALRMVLPSLPAWIAPHPMAALPQAVPSPFEIEIVRESASQVAAPVAAFDWAALMLAVWLGGALIHFVWHLASYSLFVRRTIGQATPLPMLDRNRVEVCASPAVRGPFATGIFVKTIVLPADYRRRYDADELRLAMAHETAHHRRCDMSANLAALVMLSLHWFNPIAWRAHRAFRVDQELACDAIVLAKATPAERHAYGSALLKSTCDRLPMAACALGAGDDLKRRLKMMAHSRPSDRAVRIGVALATLLTGGGLLLTASGGIAAETRQAVKTGVKQAVADTADWTPVGPVADVEPAAPIRQVALAEPARATMEGDDASNADIISPPAPPAPPAPPSPPSARSAGHDRTAWVDGKAISAQVQAAMAEARLEMSQSFRESARAQADARRAMADARRQMRGLRMQIVMRDCKGGRTETSMSSDSNGNKVQRMIVCENGGVDQAEIRRTTIEALQAARISLAAIDARALTEDARTRALAEVDRKIAELKAQ